MRSLLLSFFSILGTAFAWAPPAHALLASTNEIETIDGQSVSDGQIFWIDATPGSLAVVQDESIFAEDEDVDALALLPTGHLVLSIADTGSIGGLPTADGDLVEYDPDSGAASLLLDEAVFGTQVDVDAVHVLPNGHVLLSFQDDEEIPLGTPYRDGDVVEYDPVGGAFSLFLSESIFFDNDADVDALAVHEDGRLLLSTTGDETIGTVSPVSFNDASIVAYDLATGVAEVLISVSQRSTTNPDIDALDGATVLACGNGADDDGDGLTDHPADPGCAAVDLSERSPDFACDDGRDNDGDGLIDYPADLDCDAPDGLTESGSATECNDTLDNDDDGAIDFPADPSCRYADSALEETACSNGTDDDTDGKIDWDGGAFMNGGVPLAEADAECGDRGFRDRETAPPQGNCGLGPELPGLLFGLLGLRRRRSG